MLSFPQSLTIRSITSALMLVLFSVISTAQAACTDPARPGVNWQGCYQDGRNLIGVDMTGGNIRDSQLIRADFSGSTLAKVDGRRAKLVSANMAGVILDGANLAFADLTKANLTGASLIGVNFHSAHLFRAILRGANLTGATLDGADLLNADLSGATWIDGETVCADHSISSCK